MDVDDEEKEEEEEEEEEGEGESGDTDGDDDRWPAGGTSDNVERGDPSGGSDDIAAPFLLSEGQVVPLDAVHQMEQGSWANPIFIRERERACGWRLPEKKR